MACAVLCSISIGKLVALLKAFLKIVNAKVSIVIISNILSLNRNLGIIFIKGICLCHGMCSDQIKDGFSIKNFDYALKKIVNFLKKKENRNEIVTIFLENYIDDVKKLQQVFAKVEGFNNLVFNPYSKLWNVSSKGWPKIMDMVLKNKRILIVDDEQRAYSAKAPPGFIRSRDFLIQNHYQWYNDKYEWINFNHSDLINKNLTVGLNNTLVLDMSRCFSLHKVNYRPNWDENNHLDLGGRENLDQPINSEKLFLFNHFFGVRALGPTLNPETELLFNTREFIYKRIEAKCNPGTMNKRPNYIALDFITNSTYKEIIEPLNV